MEPCPTVKKQKTEEHQDGTAQATEPQAAAVEPLIGLQNCKPLPQGNDSSLWETTFLGRPAIVKQRLNKQGAANPAPDAKLTPLQQEIRSMVRARKMGVPTPVVYAVEPETNSFYMEKVQGHSVKHLLEQGKLKEEEVTTIAHAIGRYVAAIHDGGLVHGALSTASFIVRESSQALVVIDFGLSRNTTLTEEKGVDLYMLDLAVTSDHPTVNGLFDQIMSSYKKHSKQWSATFNKFAEVRQRKRKQAEKAAG